MKIWSGKNQGKVKHIFYHICSLDYNSTSDFKSMNFCRKNFYIGRTNTCKSIVLIVKTARITIINQLGWSPRTMKLRYYRITFAMIIGTFEYQYDIMKYT